MSNFGSAILTKMFLDQKGIYVGICSVESFCKQNISKSKSLRLAINSRL